MRRSYNLARGSLLAALVTFVLSESAAAGQEKVLYNFAGGRDGSSPSSRLILDNSGTLYGTTFTGGKHDAGTVFKLVLHGKQTVLYSFTGGDDGGNPSGDLAMDARGILYGTTVAGGKHGAGTVFQLTRNGKETVLYSFTGGSDGGNPHGGVFMDGDGNLYGTTKAGGAIGEGTVFKLKPNGKEKVLHSFTSGADGGEPEGGLVMDRDGNLYGTASLGGALNQGVVFKIKPNGKEKVLHSFAGVAGSDGSSPTSSLFIDFFGTIYGTTRTGGSGLAGTVFQLTPDGKETVLHAFTGGKDGANPVGSVVTDNVGNLYGVTSAGIGGQPSAGTVFRVSPEGKDKVIHSFDLSVDPNDGIEPANGLILDEAGVLYGVTDRGGTSGHGTVFRVRI